MFAAAVEVVHSAAALQVAGERMVLAQVDRLDLVESLAREETSLAVEHHMGQDLGNRSQDQEEGHQEIRLCQSPDCACEEGEGMVGILDHREEVGRRVVAEVGSVCQLAVGDV